MVLGQNASNAVIRRIEKGLYSNCLRKHEQLCNYYVRALLPVSEKVYITGAGLTQHPPTPSTPPPPQLSSHFRLSSPVFPVPGIAPSARFLITGDVSILSSVRASVCCLEIVLLFAENDRDVGMW
jgi:hypothetical protein